MSCSQLTRLCSCLMQQLLSRDSRPCSQTPALQQAGEEHSGEEMSLQAALTNDGECIFSALSPGSPEGLSLRCPQWELPKGSLRKFLSLLPSLPISLPHCPAGISWNHLPKKRLAVELSSQGHLQIKYLHSNLCLRVRLRGTQTKTRASSLFQSHRPIIPLLLQRRNRRLRECKSLA